MPPLRGVGGANSGDVDPDAIATGATDEPDDLDNVLRELGSGSASGDTTVLVSKFNEGSSARHGFDMCGRYAAAGFDPFTLPREFGPGRFRMHFKRGNRIVRNIERSFILPVTAAPVVPSESAAQVELRESRGFERQMLLTLLTGLVGKPAGATAPGVTVPDMIALFNAGRAASAAAPAPLDAIREAITLGRTLGNGPGAEGDEGDEGVRRGQPRESFLERLAPRMFDLIEKAMAAPRAAAPEGPPGLPQPSGAAVVSPVQPASDATAAPFEAMVREYVPRIIAEAKSGHDARTWGAFVGERCPEAYAPHLVRFASGTPDERQGLMAQYAPELIAYQGWISEACQGVMDVFEPETEDGPTDAEEGDSGAA